MAKPKPQRLRDPDVGHALLAQVLEHPDDDQPRLVYADWLEEQGNPFAQLIRMQCQSSRLAGAKKKAIETREVNLVKKHYASWIAPIDSWVADPYFVRGTLSRIYCKTGQYVQRATQETLLPAVMLFGVRQTMLRGQSVKLASCTTLAWTSELWWWDSQLDDNGVAALADSPNVERLFALTLEKVRCTNDGLGKLARSKRLGRLRHFGLPAPVHLGAYDARGIIDVLENHPITSLDLTGVNSLKLGALLADEAVARLDTLAVTSRGITDVARSTQLTGLETLRIDTFSSVKDSDVERLLDNSTFARLDKLELKIWGRLGAGVVERLRERFGAGLSYRPTGP